MGVLRLALAQTKFGDVQGGEQRVEVHAGIQNPNITPDNVHAVTEALDKPLCKAL